MITQRLAVEGLGEVVYSDGTLVDNVKDLKGRLISPRNEAYARIHTSGKEDIGKTDGTRVALEVDYMKGEAPVLTRYDKLSHALAKQVVEANSQRKYHYTDSTKRYETKRKHADKEEKQGLVPQERTAITLPRVSFGMTLTDNRNYLDFVLQDLAEEYFHQNGDVSINFYPVDKSVVDGNQPDLLTNTNGTILVPYLWFWGLDNRSELGGNWSAFYNNWARGVLESAEGSAKFFRGKTKLPYTPKEFAKQALRVEKVRNALRTGKIDISKLEEELEKVSEFLNLE